MGQLDNDHDVNDVPCVLLSCWCLAVYRIWLRVADKIEMKIVLLTNGDVWVRALQVKRQTQTHDQKKRISTFQRGTHPLI